MKPAVANPCSEFALTGAVDAEQQVVAPAAWWWAFVAAGQAMQIQFMAGAGLCAKPVQTGRAGVRMRSVRRIDIAPAARAPMAVNVGEPA